MKKRIVECDNTYRIQEYYLNDVFGREKRWYWATETNNLTGYHDIVEFKNSDDAKNYAKKQDMNNWTVVEELK